jgi:hypothetical protein
MMIRPWVLLLTLAAVLTGCVSTDPVKFDQQVRKWVPLGTPAVDAQRIMESHRFDVVLVKKDSPFNRFGRDYLQCDRSQVFFHNWVTQIFLEDDKVSGYANGEVESNF